MELGYFNVDHFWSECYYNNGNAGGMDFSNDTFENRCYCNVDHHERCKCYYNDGNAGGFDLSNDTFENRCYYNVAIFEDGDSILSNYTFGSWFLVRVPENRCDFNDDTFKDRCYYNVDIFEDGDFILSNDTFGSWFLVRVPEDRCYFSVGTFENRCNESDPSKRGLMMTTFQPRQ